MTFIHNIQAGFAPTVVTDEEADRGSLVEQVVITSSLAVAGYFAMNWLSTSVLNKFADTAQCVEGTNTFQTSTVSNNCMNTTTSKGTTNSFKNDTGYKSRFGN